MDREEILKKAQAENRDERELQIKVKSVTWAFIVMVVMAAVFTFIRARQGLPVMDLCATVCGSVCAAMTYRLIKTKDKFYLVLALITFAAMVLGIVRFAMGK